MAGIQPIGPNSIPRAAVGPGVRGPGGNVQSQDGLAQQIAAKNQAASRQPAEVDPTTLAQQLGSQAMNSVDPVSALDVLT